MFTITNPHGLHARPSATLVKVAKEFQSEIWVANPDGDGKSVNAKSLMKLVSLGVKVVIACNLSLKVMMHSKPLAKLVSQSPMVLGEGAGHE